MRSELIITYESLLSEPIRANQACRFWISEQRRFSAGKGRCRQVQMIEEEGGEEKEEEEEEEGEEEEEEREKEMAKAKRY